jgi:hypothetical protein
VTYFKVLSQHSLEVLTWVNQSVQCLTSDWTTGVRSLPAAQDFSTSLCVKTNSEAHPAFYPMGRGSPLPGGKAQSGSDADH